MSLVAKEEQHLRLPTAAAQIILATAGMLCIFVLFYFLNYYAFTRQRHFESWAGVVLYYVFPAGLAILFLAALRLRPATKISLALMVCSGAISILSLEILLGVWFNLPSVTQDQTRKAIANAATAAGVNADPRTKLEVINALVRQGVDAVPSVFPAAFYKKQDDGTVKSSIDIKGVELLPLAGIANKVVVLCNESGKYVTFRSDIHGFNNPPNVWSERPIDIAAVGDSFVQGYCVENSFVKLIRNQYHSTLNLGIEGNGPLIMLATVKEYASAVKPKIVLWFYYEGNDLSDLTTERKSPLLRRYLTDGFSQGLISRQDEIDHALTEYVGAIESKSNLRVKLEEAWGLLEDNRLRDFRQLQNRIGGVVRLTEVRQRLGLVYGVENPSTHPAGTVAVGSNIPRSDWLRSQTDLLQDILLEARRSVEGWGGKIYFVYLPQYYRYAPNFPATPERDDVLSAAKKAGLAVIDVHESFKNYSDPLALFPFRKEGHYNQEGSRVVAEQVLRSISSGN